MSDSESIEAYLAKADESLTGAESECANRRFNDCTNRAYYASFQAAIAALLRIGIGPSARDEQWRHHAVQAQFSEQLINRRKVYPANFKSILERGALLRGRVDYETQQVTEAQATRVVRQSRDFVETVRRRGGST